MDNELVMYIIVNDELGMSPGKFGSQIGHIVQLLIEELVTDTYESVNLSKSCIDYAKWRDSPTKIILKARGSRFSELLKIEGARYFRDSGRTTQNTSSEITAIGFFPSNELKEMFVGYDLLR